MGRKRRLPQLAACGLVGAMVVAGCGSGGAADGGGPDDPIKIMTIGTFESPHIAFPAVRTAMQAGVDELNAKGGIDGRKVAVEFCNDAFDPNEAVSCARQAVDEGVVAVVGTSTHYTASILPILEAAEVPSISGFVDDSSEAVSPVSYPITSGSRGTVIGAGRVAAQLGGKKVVTLYADVSSGPPAAGWTADGAKAVGGTVIPVPVQIGLPDYSAAASTALEQKPDAVVINTVPDDAVRIISALRQAGFTGIIAGSALTMVTPASIRALGAAANNVVTVSRCAPMDGTGGAAVQDFLSAMARAGVDGQPDDATCAAWGSLQLFAQAAKGRQITDGKSVIAALDQVKTPVDIGVIAPYPGIPTAPPVADYPRVGNWKVNASKIVDGRATSVVPFFDAVSPA